MHILVTGASGFLGTALCRRLREQGHELVALSSRVADLRIAGSLQKWNASPFDHIYHLAAWTQAGDFCLRHPGEQWVINQQINTNVLAWWHECQPQAKLICMGTSCSYAPGADLLEDRYLIGEPIDSLYTYAMTKRMLYIGLRSLQKQFGLRYLCLVPSTLYGPGYHTDGRQMHFIFDLIRKILRGKKFGESVSLWGDGYQRREIVYVEDFVDAAIRLADTQDNELINIGAGEEHTIRSFASMISDIAGYDAESIQYDTSRYVGAKSKCLDITKLRKLVGSFPPTSLRGGLEKTITWFHEEGMI